MRPEDETSLSPREHDGYQEYRYTDLEYFTFSNEVISAFFISWPYVTFSGLDMSLVIFNMFNKELVHRIQIVDGAKDKTNMKIC